MYSSSTAPSTSAAGASSNLSPNGRDLSCQVIHHKAGACPCSTSTCPQKQTRLHAPRGLHTTCPCDVGETKLLYGQFPTEKPALSQDLIRQISLGMYHMEKENSPCRTASSSLSWRERHPFLVWVRLVQEKLQYSEPGSRCLLPGSRRLLRNRSLPGVLSLL